MTIKDYPTYYVTPLRVDSLVTAAFLLGNVVLTIVVVHFSNYSIPKKFGGPLIVIYLLYDVFLVLIGTNVIDNVRIN